MSFVPGGGIKTLDDIKLRCVIDEMTECWNWKGARTGGGNPSAWFPVVGKTLGLGTIIMILEKGRPPKPGYVYARVCRNAMCANPKHRREQKPGVANLGKKYDAIRRAKQARGKRANSKLTEAQVEEIRTGCDRAIDAAEKHGIDISYVWRIRRNEARISLSGASIFNLGG